ncbi:glycine cleavage system protein GcvH [Salinispira pacifica]|uniref:Glycine cleavage system H protein n=1 Tax=Salinispira pacifica TaxID=1307761 RepID=V5WCE8_9SPIO|nr:glycine cleavage system protein GcvH [Salinispira pacifica]AHC13457.1 Glycine cleavage system H protein [Salinispira pacifica]
MKYDKAVMYQKSHEWARKDGNTVVVGISDYAQDSLGDVVFVELPEVGSSMSQGDAFGVVESVKAASDVFVPVSGEITEVNEELSDNPELINEDPFGKGWIIKIQASDVSELDGLMDADAYEEYTKDLDD